tara:strand:+ start:295 stop:411 length:117 start_codon:yes stop_codon:yes gene_type:complete
MICYLKDKSQILMTFYNGNNKIIPIIIDPIMGEFLNEK